MSRPAPFRSPGDAVRRVGRRLLVVASLVLLLAPATESHLERGMAVHVEQSAPHHAPAHDPERCLACVLLAVHSRAAERSAVSAPARTERMRIAPVSRCTVASVDAPSNACRAPPPLA